MGILKLAVPAIILTGGLLLSTVNSYGTADYTKKEKKSCTFCHVKPGSADLNDAGKYYQENKYSLEGYKPK